MESGWPPLSDSSQTVPTSLSPAATRKHWTPPSSDSVPELRASAVMLRTSMIWTACSFR